MPGPGVIATSSAAARNGRKVWKSGIVHPVIAHVLVGAPVGNIFGADMLRDRNDLKRLAGSTCDIPDSLAHQKPCYRGHEGNTASLGVSFILADDPVFLYAPIFTPEAHRAAKGISVR